MRSETGHRQRVKDRYRKEGLDNFEESHMLELLLFYAIPRRDTKPIARRLLDRFGSVASVMDASPEALLRTVKKGIDDFVGEAPQFDDITMLCMEYRGPEGTT